MARRPCEAARRRLATKRTKQRGTKVSLIDHELSAVGSRFRLLEWWRGVSVISILLAIAGLAMLAMQLTGQWFHPWSGWALLIGGLLCLSLTALSTWFQYRDNRWIAQKVEDRFPELDQRLITTLDQFERNEGKPLDFLQHTVFQEAITHSYHNPWTNVVPDRLVHAFRSRGLVAFCLMFAAAIGLMKLPPGHNALVASQQQRTQNDLSDERMDFEIKVEPGNAEVEKGTSLIVVARFGKTVPKVAELVATSGDEALSITMSRSLDDPLFGGTISEVQEPLEYHVAYRGRKSETYRVTVFTYPELVRADALLEYPSYTNMVDKRVEDTRRISVVEGTRVSWEMHLNKPGIEAELVPVDGGDAIPLKVDANDPLNHLVSLDMVESATWKLVLTDSDGRENRNPPKITAKVTPNRPPSLKLELARDASVSPLEEFMVKASVSDDYGLTKYGLNYTLASASAKDIVLGEQSSRREKKTAEHQLDFEALEAEPDQLLSYYFWAEDTDSQGNPRRTLSDMFFAEVRHFEEIFRQGEQQAQQQQQQQQQQSQNAQDATQLAELQKQIINATWKLIRRETAPEVTEAFNDDISVIVESQQAASEKLQELGENLQDAESKTHLNTVKKHMLNALQELMTSYSDDTAKPLPDAMSAERAAYEGLLKLRAREHQVQQQQQQSSQQSQQSSSRQRFQQQLQQLELKNDQNRYETEQQAQEEEDQAQTELRQALSRLRELAQRQEDLNKQLQELQNALEQAETEEEREEIERQLKRLRDQQEEMLRDTDELMERLNESENQEALQETQEQLEQTRDQMRESAEQLQRGEVTPALASGTRAQRELEEMREELRRQSANQFSDQMRDMRDRARELETKQQEIGEQLANESEAQERAGTGLRREEPKGENEDLGEALREQNQKLNELLQEIEETVREAEESEPLLAENLYEAFREVGQNRTADKLDAAAEYSERGLNEQALDLETDARESISDFRQQIEVAAESVLGDETQALRTAQRMLQELERQLDEEISQNDEAYREERERARQEDAEAQARNGEPSSILEAVGRNQGDPTERGDGQQTGEEAERSEQDDRERTNQDRQSREGERQEGEPQEDQPRDGQQRGDQPGRQPSDRDGSESESDSEQRSEGEPSQQGQPGDSPSEQESQRQQEGQQSSESQQQSEDPQGQQRGQQQGQQEGRQPREGEQQGGGGGQQQQPDDDNQARRGRQPQQDSRRRGGDDRQFGGGLGGWERLDVAPITGDDFREWSDRMRDVEEIVDDPELRAEAARIRERARAFRQEYKRHSEEPKWDLIRDMVARPLRELRQEVSEELLRRAAEKNELVPIDRDPVPEQFVEQVRRYYESLGSGK